MAYSVDTYVSAGEATYTVTFAYLLQAHVTCEVNDVSVAFTWDDSTTIRPDVTPTTGDIVALIRASSPGTRLTDHVDATVLTEAALDVDGNQMFYLVQEALDDAAGQLTKNGALTTWDSQDLPFPTLGIGLARTEGTLHVHTATAGSITANVGADDLVVENDGIGGITILTPDANVGQLVFQGISKAGEITIHFISLFQAKTS